MQLPKLDAQLKAEVSRLLELGELDSAIRKALVILKTRITRRFGLSDDLDGTALVNKVFGEQSELLPHLNSSDRQAYRNLFSGLFGVVRNKYAHNHIKAEVIEASAVVCSVNLCLKLIGDYRIELYDILIADNSDLVRGMNAELAKSFGRSCQVAGSLSEGKDIVDRHGPPALLITGLRLDGADGLTGGVELATHVKSRNPDCRVIYATGAPRAISDLVKGDYQIVKPYTKEAFSALVARVWKELSDD